mgnify:CR=1 FL=1
MVLGEKGETYRVYRITPNGTEIQIGGGWSLEDAEMVKGVNEKEYPEWKGRLFIGIDGNPAVEDVWRP